MESCGWALCIATHSVCQVLKAQHPRRMCMAGCCTPQLKLLQDAASNEAAQSPHAGRAKATEGSALAAAQDQPRICSLRCIDDASETRWRTARRLEHMSVGSGRGVVPR
eukprot:360819-Chlamydomonas_euryale.AAC.2